MNNMILQFKIKYKSTYIPIYQISRMTNGTKPAKRLIRKYLKKPSTNRGLKHQQELLSTCNL
ncbi:GSCOCG00005561001-RA-CDS [Cotesia congregata]|nr:GSCOCG00011071001-RA-CDS [Cotesia congregata]CAD6224804.1 GSCOCG00005561001-RA-CDS [Cotesia congregata]